MKATTATTPRRHSYSNGLLYLVTSFAISGAFAFAPVSQTPWRRSDVRSTGSTLLVASETTSTEVLEQGGDWWKDFKLEHAHVADRVRGDFEILETKLGDDAKPLIYLDSAATSQKPKQVVDAISNYYNKQNSNVHRGAHTLSREATAAYEAARDTVASFVNANSRNEIVFTSGATQALNLLAYTYGRSQLHSGDEIVLSVMEHHSNLVPWQILAKERGVVLKFVEVDESTGGLDLAQFESHLNSEKTKLVAIQHVSNVMGCINPVEDMVKMVREKAHPDAKIILDACQSVPHMKVDVQQLGVDFMAASGHKLCGPTGIGFLWGREDLLNELPPYQSGGEMIDTVSLDGVTFAKSPARFEAGTPPIAQAVGMGAAIRYLNEVVGMDDMEAYESELGAYLHRRLAGVEGVTVLGPPVGTPRAALCAFAVDGVHPSDLSSFLDMEGVAVRAGHHCCQPLHQELGLSHSARASLGVYNTKNDVDVFIEKLEGTISFFRGLESGGGEGSGDDFVPFI